MELTIYDLLENGANVTSDNRWLIMYPDDDNKRLWRVFENKRYARKMTRLYEGYDESEAVKVMMEEED